VKEYDLSRLKVLVIEPHELMRNLMRDVFRTLNVEEIQVVPTVESAETTLGAFNPDIIFTDWSPALDGVEFIRKIRMEQGATDDRFVPIVLVSAYTDLKNVCIARDSGMSEFLAKPVSAQLIYKRICTILEKPRDYIDTDDFFGPDRRRRNVDITITDRRKAA